MMRTRVRLVLLVGLPGAGKSTVGARLAQRLGWSFHDVDQEIVRRSGRSIADMFERDGESAFRAMELRLTAELCSSPDRVVAPGGGWAAQPGSLESLPAHAAVVWLRVSTEEAIRRLRGSPVRRPLLDGDDPLAALAALSLQRTQRYARADLVTDVDGRSADEVTDTIIEWLEQSTS